jgi:4-amino-4-deoxy-L-arabinose transferase-like glycosyltransferase
MDRRPGWLSDRSALLAFLAVALLLRLPGHLNSGLWFDEIWMLGESIRIPFAALFTTFESDNNHPFYSVLAWLSVHAFGEHAWTLRLPAVLFGAASIGMTWKLALLVTDRVEASLATALLAVSYHHVWFSQNARGYTMLLFWTLAATYFLVKTYSGAGRRDWIAYAVCLALATYTHASAIFVAAGHAVVAIAVLATPRGRSAANEERWAPLLGLVLAGLVSLLLHAGMLGDMLAFFTAEPPVSAQVAEEGSREWTTLWWTLSAVVGSLGVPAPIAYGALLVGASLAVTGTIVSWRRDWRTTLLYLVPGVIAVIATVGMGRSLRPRFLFHLSGFALLVVVAGVFAGCRWAARRVPDPSRAKAEDWLVGAAAAAMILASLAILPRAYALPKQDFEGALEYVRTARQVGDEVATAGLTTLPYRIYYGEDFPEVTSIDGLDRLLSEHSAVYVLHTIPIYLESTAPDLADRLAAAPEVARFRGSLGDGDVVVLRMVGAATRE